MTTNKSAKLRNLIRYCAVCEKQLNIVVYSNKTYKGGHFFGKIEIGKKKKVEYWECNHCYNNYDAISQKAILKV